MDTNETNGTKKKRVNTAFFGRARRYEILEKVAYVAVGVIALLLIISIVTKTEVFVEKNVNFEYLRVHMEQKGYYCEMIHASGGQCFFKNEYTQSVFVRYDNGFKFSTQTANYRLTITHTSDMKDSINFQTFSTAYYGYKNRYYVCTFKDPENILEGIDKCKTQNGEELDAQVYLGIINMTLNDLNEIIDSSGYKKDVLIKDYLWQKNK